MNTLVETDLDRAMPQFAMLKKKSIEKYPNTYISPYDNPHNYTSKTVGHI